jgi:rSAM/selenodomain-associated transferase 2
VTLVAFDAHPGNFIVREDGRAMLVDLEKCRYSHPGLDLAHATLYTSTTWDVDGRCALTPAQVAGCYRAWAGMRARPGRGGRRLAPAAAACHVVVVDHLVREVARAVAAGGVAAEAMARTGRSSAAMSGWWPMSGSGSTTTWTPRWFGRCDRLRRTGRGAGPMRLAIVVPVLDEAAQVVSRLQALAPMRGRGVRVIVVDGGSLDGTAAQAAPWADQVLQAPRGRAAQMNAGARAAAALGADTLLFLHADTRLPEGAVALIGRAMGNGAEWGRFDVHIEGRHPLLPMVATLMNLRSRLTGIATGDQAVFVRRRLFEAVGGFPEQPLMEDIELSARLSQVSAPACLRERVTTSGRRWDRHGLWATVVLMWRLRAAYALGADPHALALRYGYRPRATAALAIMAKAPIPGLAKTRLARCWARPERPGRSGVSSCAPWPACGPLRWVLSPCGALLMRSIACFACCGTPGRCQPAPA